MDETGNPCNDCGVAEHKAGTMQQTQGEQVIRDLIMSERYRQSPYNQGNASSARIREIEMSDELLAAVDRSATYRAYYIKHLCLDLTTQLVCLTMISMFTKFINVLTLQHKVS